jgi:hypothetical protein
MESVDGVDYRLSVDGLAFVTDSGLGSNGYHYMAFGGFGGCIGDWISDMRNEWDSVRYGTIGFGERIVGADPAAGVSRSTEEHRGTQLHGDVGLAELCVHR